MTSSPAKGFEKLNPSPPQKENAAKAFMAATIVRHLDTFEFCEAAQTKVSRLRTLMGRKLFAPHIKGGGKGRRHLFLPSQVAEYKEIEKKFFSPSYARPEQVPIPLHAKQTEEERVAFTMFEKGASLRDVMKKTGITPEGVQQLHRAWSEVDGGIFISSDLVKTINIQGLGTLTKAQDILDILMTHRGEGACVSCRRGKRVFCSSCVKASTKQAIAQALEASRLAREKKAEETPPEPPHVHSFGPRGRAQCACGQLPGERVA